MQAFKNLAPLLLLLSCSLTCSITVLAQTPSEICLPEAQAAVIGKALKDGEKLKTAYKAERSLNKELTKQNSLQGEKLTSQAKTIYYQDATIASQDTLLVDSNTKLEVAKAKAHRNGLRFWLLVALNVAAAGLYLSH